MGIRFGFNKFVCTKFFLYIFSIFFGLCSLIILVVAAIILRDFRGIMSRMSGLRILNIMDFEAFPISFLVISSFMIVVASCAFGIALFFFQDRRFRARVTTKIHYVIFTFTLLLLIILISQIATAIYGVSVLPKKGFKSHLNFKESFMNYNIRMEDTYYVDFVQRTLHCCGIYSTYDYELILGIPIPQTCCPESGWICHQYNAYHNGCELELRFFYSSMYRNLSVLSFTAFGFAPVVVAALIAAVVLLISVRYSQVNRGQIRNLAREDTSRKQCSSCQSTVTNHCHNNVQQDQH
ncbi:hypothetical protein DMN91_005905 [Ooceraea biroi]|uniref:Uncharacterized protein n=1 Tax=Ooceraea biroi TaxID=2015173 RepID=A0A3L8DMW7_OOCBI|nr:CD63 antigen [Ooceraea biroi]RLU21532.1 hypothetical protein DMN91_005905 [Ooceraea biroi]